MMPYYLHYMINNDTNHFEKLMTLLDVVLLVRISLVRYLNFKLFIYRIDPAKLSRCLHLKPVSTDTLKFTWLHLISSPAKSSRISAHLPTTWTYQMLSARTIR